jgi:hypothetical protein
LELSDLGFFKKWLQSNKNFTYSFNEFFLFNKLCKFHSTHFIHFPNPTTMNPLKNSAFANSCRTLFVTAVILLFYACNFLFAQETSSGNMKIYPSFGIAAGFFYPGDVNDYIAASLAVAGVTKQYGTTDMFMNYEIHGGVTFRLKRMDFSGELAFAFAPKWILVENGDNMNFYFNRVSPGVSANYYIPMKSEKMDFFLGGGVQYHFMKFEDFNASNPGFCLRAGISMQFGRFNMQPNISFLYARSEDNYMGDFGENTFEMNYTSGLIGIIMSFHPPIDRN